MRSFFAQRSQKTAGEVGLLTSYLTTGSFGAVLSLLVIIRLDNSALFTRGLTFYEIWIVISGFLGAVAGVYLARDRLGRDGFIVPVSGIALASFAGALIAGSLALPLYGTMFGPFTLGLIFFASPVTAFLWVANLVAVHLMIRQWHAERNSIFGPSSASAVDQTFYHLRAALVAAWHSRAPARPGRSDINPRSSG